MGKTIKEWKNIFRKYLTIELNLLIEAIDKIGEFKEMKKEYKWTGLFSLANVINGITLERCEE